MENWRDYLNKHKKFILNGTHFINFAVQEPGGAMILEASYGQKVRSGRYEKDVFLSSPRCLLNSLERAQKSFLSKSTFVSVRNIAFSPKK